MHAPNGARAVSQVHGDGGAYVLGLDDTVLIFYVDGPGDMVYGRWQCDRRRWESMWTSTFGALSVTIQS